MKNLEIALITLLNYIMYSFGNLNLFYNEAYVGKLRISDILKKIPNKSNPTFVLYIYEQKFTINFK